MNPIENLKDLIVYQSQNNENISVEVLYDNEDFWLTQKSMSKLFNVEVNTINYHLKEIFATRELEENRTIRKIRTVQKEGNREVSRELAFYSLDAIIAIGYRVDSEITHNFYAMVQNKFHYAITGNTAAEIIYQKADHTKEYMGLTTWKNSPDGRILKSDVMIAKNYLDEKQIKRLERAVSGYFDYIEDLVERENTFTMEEFAKSINEFLEFRKYDVLKDNGKISRKQAEEKAENEYIEFNKNQKITSDFDRLLLEANRLNDKK